MVWLIARPVRSFSDVMLQFYNVERGGWADTFAAASVFASREGAQANLDEFWLGDAHPLQVEQTVT
jgi:hypothetical protein